MVLSYSAIAQPKEDTPAVISIASSGSTSNGQPAAGPSKPSGPEPNINHLILDAGPLLSLAPLRHLAQTFHTTPMVLAELRDPKARQHWENLALSGVDVKVEPPSAEAMSKVVAFAKKTGDFAVLSQTDLSVIALTYQYEFKENGDKHIRTEPGQKKATSTPAATATASAASAAPIEDEESSNGDSSDEDGDEDEGNAEDGEDEGGEAEEGQDTTYTATPLTEVTQSIEQVLLDPSVSSDNLESQDSADVQPTSRAPPNRDADEFKANDEDDESEGGEWITPSNVSKHRSHDLGLLPTDAGGAKSSEPIAAACMTGDFAVQNVLLGIGLGLVGEGGKRIGKVKSFVLRCHACFKICKDSSKRFCPSCGNPSLLRTTVTVSAKTGEQQIHLKKNFQYHLRGSKFTIPDAKPGRAKGQLKGGTGLILREDQREWQDAVRSQEIKRQKEERRAAKGALDGWNDPDWLPEIITVGMSGKGRSGGRDMPSIGHGRKNPNQSRRKR